MEIKHATLENVLNRIKTKSHWEQLSDGSRLYWKEEGDDLLGDKCGFTFIQVNRVSYPMNSDFLDENTEYEVLLHGTAYFDGIRHLHFGDEASDNLGYFYYPEMDDIIEVLNVLKTLEDKYCNKD